MEVKAFVAGLIVADPYLVGRAVIVMVLTVADLHLAGQAVSVTGRIAVDLHSKRDLFAKAKAIMAATPLLTKAVVAGEVIVEMLLNVKLKFLA